LNNEQGNVALGGKVENFPCVIYNALPHSFSSFPGRIIDILSSQILFIGFSPKVTNEFKAASFCCLLLVNQFRVCANRKFLRVKVNIKTVTFLTPITNQRF
jgi:hypothetical protein